MSVPAMIVDKLKNYEYEKRGCGDAVGDIYALIHHIADLEEEIDDLKEAVPRTVEGDGSDLPFRTVVLDVDKDAWQRTHSGIWEFVGGAYDLRETLSPRWAPYTVIYTPKGES